MKMEKIKTVRLIGLGAMGSFFAPKLSLLPDIDFKIIAGGQRASRLKEKGIFLGEKNYRFQIEDPAVSPARPADLIIIAVKSYSLDQALLDIENQVGPNTQIMSVLNGVDSETIVAAKYGAEKVLPSYMRVSIVMSDGVSNYNGQAGKVHFGEWQNDPGVYSERVQAVAELFAAAGIPYQIDADLRHGLWFKFMCNVGENLTCALLGVPFGAFRTSVGANYLRVNAMREVIAVANAKGIDLSEADIEAQEPVLKTLPYENKPSTLQDLEHGVRTEIDTFAGAVIRLGAETGIKTPLALAFYHGIKTLEEKNEGAFCSQGK
jgi:2-dehydropantoate 2-reductase